MIHAQYFRQDSLGIYRFSRKEFEESMKVVMSSHGYTNPKDFFITKNVKISPSSIIRYFNYKSNGNIFPFGYILFQKRGKNK